MNLQLSLQSTFHGPLAFIPHPARPIFHRLRQPTLSELESGRLLTYDTSFYRNAYAMVSLSLGAPVGYSTRAVHRLDLISSPVLFPRYKAQHHAVVWTIVDRISSGFVCTGVTRACDATNCAQIRYLAGKCGSRRIVSGSALVGTVVGSCTNYTLPLLIHVPDRLLTLHQSLARRCCP